MLETDNCPVCGTLCVLELGCATCKTCKTRWRRREDRAAGSIIYEKWAYRIPEISIPFPTVGGGIKLPPRSGRWIRLKEIQQADVKPEQIPIAQPLSKQKTLAEELTLVRPHATALYNSRLSKGDRIKGEVTSDIPINVLFMDEINADKIERGKKNESKDGTYDVYQTKILFTAPRKGNWFVALENKSKTPAKVKVYLYTEEV